MTRESWIEEFLTNIEKLDDYEATKTLLDWADQISIETRAATLAEEDRRVWCEAYAKSILLKPRIDLHINAENRDSQIADLHLSAYREARAAWDARKEEQR